MSFGLRDEDISYIKKVIKKYQEINKALIFGSRAKVNYKNGSDIDIAIIGENVSFDTVSKLMGEFEDSHLPYMFDIIDYIHLNDKDVKEHIDRVGKVIFTRDK